MGNALTISDHQLNHTIHNYDFQQIQITVPNLSTPDENQIAFMASTDPYLNYETSANWHDRGVVSREQVDNRRGERLYKTRWRI